VAVDNPAGAVAVPSSDYDLLITDVVMPGMDGPQLVRALRLGRPDLPVLFVSGYSQVTAGSLGLDEPRTALLSKPFNQAELASAARKVLDETKGR
jgi:two-component system cell cycle sensor histidine kinase/response regulator CckA